MKANMPKAFKHLTKNEQDRILRAMEDAMDNMLCDAQIVWLKMACCILSKLGLSKDDILVFVGNWKMMYRKNARIKDKAEQDAFLDPQLCEIFGEGGFPEEFVESMKEIGR